ncbi:hypothetical protein PANA5342_2655 [Pantoea ananatis LMG 5342]|uniref:ASCH domain-containing protein n=1 Tax=Pantoea ananas TaxID=553 RepID=UPI000241878A|nr:ASCH domain-containing protein [Pantoea ananatis]CCF10048.1 hypothetical protein PANA5342_2655 [Pantoea ananatis LMG 5342]
MQMLNIVPRLMTALRAGEKRHTIRWQEQKITPGPLCYVSNEDPATWVIVDVAQVVTMPLSSVAHYLGKGDEWPDAVLLAGMQEHYPAIQLDSQVEVIHHSAPRQDERALHLALLAALTVLECSLHHEKRHDLAWLDQRLHPEFKEITLSGTLLNREQIIAALMNEENAQAIISSDFQLMEVGTQHAICFTAPRSQTAAVPHYVRPTGLSAAHGWQMIFHQGSTAAAGS